MKAYYFLCRNGKIISSRFQFSNVVLNPRLLKKRFGQKGAKSSVLECITWFFVTQHKNEGATFNPFILFSTFFIILAVINQAAAQSTFFATPQKATEIPVIILPELDNAHLLANEIANRTASRPPQFATPRSLNISTETHGSWQIISPGLSCWQLRIISPGAFSINLGFSEFSMPPSGKLFLHAPSTNETTGPFTPADNENHQQFWSPILPGDEILLQVNITPEHIPDLNLQLAFLNHDFANILNANSGDCNLDVICGAADGWENVDNFRDIIRSVGLITINGTGICSGFLVNNHRQDCKPYFMTADHCEIGITDAPAVVVYWNYENSFCRQPGSPESGNPGNGQFNTFNSGSTLKANFQPTDMTLLELDDPVNENADAFFAGWNANNEAPLSSIAIHHPLAEEKRISFENQPSFISSLFNDVPDDTGTHIYVEDWDDGTTEQGSSGCPLFDQNKRVVGQLHGGNAACGNDDADWFGRLAVSWNGGNTPESSLQSWLDPDNTGVLTLDGRDNSLCLSTDFSIASAQDFYENCLNTTTEISLNIGAAFADEVFLTATGNPPGTTVSFSENPVSPGSSLMASVDNVDFTGNYTLIFDANDGTNQAETSVEVFISGLPEAINLSTPAANQVGVSINPVFEWTGSPSADVYVFTLATDPGFSNIIINETLTGNSLTASSSLEFNTAYFWKVDVFNECGTFQLNAPFQFQTSPDLALDIFPNALQACSGAFLNFDININDGFGGPVTISIGDFPGTGEISLSQNPAMPGATVDAYVSNMLFAEPGDYLVPVQLSDGMLVVSGDFPLTILGIPSATILNFPANGATEISTNPALSWQAISGANQYILYVAKDENFTDVVYTNTFTNNNHTISQSLEPGTWYYWQIYAQNNCGSTISQTHYFKTAGTLGNTDISQTPILLYPNPNPGRFYLSGLNRAHCNIAIFALDGKAVYFNQQKTGDLLEIELPFVDTGIFLMKIMQGNEVFTVKILVQGAQ